MSLPRRTLQLLVWTHISVLGSSTCLVGILGGSVSLPCEVTPLTYALDKLLVYWQTKGPAGDDITVVALVYGEIEERFQDQKYKGRAGVSRGGLASGDFTLHLRGLSWGDAGTYDCIIMLQRSSVHFLKNSSATLEVKAKFSHPVVTSLAPGPVERGQEVTLTCSTLADSRGPSVTWLNASDGSRLNVVQKLNEAENPDGTLSVLSAISITATSALNVTCAVRTDAGNATSLPYELKVAPEDPRRESLTGPRTAVTAGLCTVALLAVAAVALLLYKRGRLYTLYRAIHGRGQRPDTG
ncbi:ICOS ligand isoform X2 [Spea bombifrons]|uniref:ICOS ligand isoform X2 n=1 Tax=Spea bombifrons TaxID=233779 RepID=UPI00234BD5A7|nr:ICOS ligand isoform X2 [Spea bombifrons]